MTKNPSFGFAVFCIFQTNSTPSKYEIFAKYGLFSSDLGFWSLSHEGRCFYPSSVDMGSLFCLRTLSDDQLVLFFRDFFKVVVLIIGILMFTKFVFNFNISNLITGLSIVTAAIALATRESLENLIASFIIFFDKPFTLGDLVKVEAITGTVEKIGLRSTRIRTDQKTIVTVPNKKMVDAELENITDRALWRVRFVIGLNYAMDASKLESILSDMRDNLKSNPMLDENPLVRFEHFGSSSLDVLVSYMVKTNDYEVMIVEREKINFEIMRIVKAGGGDFAFPSTSVYIQQDYRNA